MSDFSAMEIILFILGPGLLLGVPVLLITPCLIWDLYCWFRGRSAIEPMKTESSD